MGIIASNKPITKIMLLASLFAGNNLLTLNPQVLQNLRDFDTRGRGFSIIFEYVLAKNCNVDYYNINRVAWIRKESGTKLSQELSFFTIKKWRKHGFKATVNI